jgi:hypothetical protein
MTAWRVAIPVYWIFIWRFRTFIGCGISMFLKKSRYEKTFRDLGSGLL